jgi:two-component system response regulator HydG
MEGDRVRILIVDDDETFLGDLASLMTDRYEIVMAHNAKEAVSAYDKLGFDAVLLDIDLGRGVDGFEVLDTFRASDPALPVIMVTRDSSAASATQALKKGAVDYIDKKPDLGDLERRISRAIEEQRVMRLNEALRQEIDELHGEMIGESAKMRALRREIAFAAQGTGPVLITGETGTGKELVAREIHRLFSPGKAFVPLNCAAVPRDTFSLKLFGSMRGAFTGAEEIPGVFELAQDGILFLDEITEVDEKLQVVLLRVIQEREFERHGSSRKMPFRGKLLASTNRDLSASLENGSLRKDLYFRFGAHVINVPPLRARREDIPLLARYFLARKSVELKRPKREIDDEMMTDLCRRDWPGNIRELENAIEAYVVRGAFVDSKMPAGDSSGALSNEALFRMNYHDAKDAVIMDFKRKYAAAIIAACGGDLGAAAERMGLSRYGLQKILNEIKRSDSPPSLHGPGEKPQR